MPRPLSAARTLLFGESSVIYTFEWKNVQTVDAAPWSCGYCSNQVSSNSGWVATIQGAPTAYVRLCPECMGPTFFDYLGNAYPGAQSGKSVEHLPADVAAVYSEARACAGVNAHTAAVLVCRKILMHIAVGEGAEPGKSFLSYIEFLASKGFIPPHGLAWVDYVRKRGNEATHEIEIMTADDSTALIGFVEMLLRFIYEFPRLIPATPTPGGTT
jgi:hypothetical protein